jgi:hypothetical protein
MTYTMTLKEMNTKNNSVLAALLLSYIGLIAVIGYYHTRDKEVIESPGYIIPDESFEHNQSNYIKQYSKKGESRWNVN